jgi:hypothetical protein
LAIAIVLVTASAALPQSVPHWNVKLPAKPGVSSQKVTLAAGVLTIERVFPLTQIASISQPYQYQTNWLIDLKLTKNATMVNKLITGLVDRSPVGEVSLLFLNRTDAAQARAYLLTHLHA